MDVGNSEQHNAEGGTAEVGDLKHCVDELYVRVDKLEKRVKDVEQFYDTTSKNGLVLKDVSKEKNIRSIKKLQEEASLREAAAAKRMHDLMRQFGTIMRQITQHKWAWPFMHPVDVEGLGLHDYYEIIDRPMDFSTIKNQMEAKYGVGYKHVREICNDMRLVFQNAMQYNDEKSDVHMMASSLSAKFEEKWLQLLPKVIEEEKRREDEEAEPKVHMQIAREIANAKTSKDLTNKLYEVSSRLDELGETVVQKCRKISIEEKRNIGIALTQLSPEQLSMALEIVAQNNPNFQSTASEVNLDIDAQSEKTLWRLKFFLEDVLETERRKM